MHAACYAGDITGSPNKLALIRARKSRGADHWDKDDYDVRLGDASGPVVGRIMRHPQGPEAQPWFWTTAQKSHHQFTIADIQLHANSVRTVDQLSLRNGDCPFFNRTDTRSTN
jgi:hypothetical protein